MRILLVDDDLFLLETLRDKLTREAFIVDTATDGEKASYMARTGGYDLMILDNMLPKKNAPQVCQEIRNIGTEIPILIISGKTDPAEKIKLLNHGADDYLSKPFSYLELLARARALLRRPYQIKSSILSLEDMILNSHKQKVTKNGKELTLTRKEYLLLECFMRRKGEVVSRGELIEKVWDSEFDPFSNTLESHILNLRKKIGSRGRNKILKTIPGRGYRLEAKIDIDSISKI